MDNLINNYWYSLGKDIAAIGLTAWGLIIATKGLVTWKRQIKGSKEFEAGYNLHLSILKLRDAVRYVRNPAIWPSESYRALQYSRSKYPDKTKEEIEKNSHAYVYEMRWEKITEAYTEVESYLLAAEVLWGPLILDLIRPINKKVNQLNIALKQYFQPELRVKDTTQLFSIIYDKGDGSEAEDAFSSEINNSIKKVADYIQYKIS